MPNQDDPNKTESHPPSTNSGDSTENIVDSIVGNFKTLLIAIGGLTLVLSILILLPMFLTYLSEGDYRAPSEIHPTDSANKNSQNAYNLVKPDK